jgi:hypothetical protein
MPTAVAVGGRKEGVPRGEWSFATRFCIPSPPKTEAGRRVFPWNKRPESRHVHQPPQVLCFDGVAAHP